MACRRRGMPDSRRRLMASSCPGEEAVGRALCSSRAGRSALERPGGGLSGADLTSAAPADAQSIEIALLDCPYEVD